MHKNNKTWGNQKLFLVTVFQFVFVITALVFSIDSFLKK